MPKKLLTGLAAVLAVAALSVVPTVAQATPHWFSEGSELPQGQVVETLAWGQLSLGHELGGAPTVCLNVAGGDIENPVGGGAGRGETTNFATYDCINAECPAGELNIGSPPPGGLVEKEFNIISPIQDLPWPSELIGVSPKFKLNSTGVVWELQCDARKVTPGHVKGTGCQPPPADESLNPACTPQGQLTKHERTPSTAPASAETNGIDELFPLAAPVVCITTGTHLLDPEWLNGTNKGNGQSRLIFNQPAGTGLSCAGDAITEKTSQSLKIMGYEGSELITVK